MRVAPSLALGWYGGVDAGKVGGPTTSLAVWLRTAGALSLRIGAFYNHRIDDVGVSCLSLTCVGDGYPQSASASASVLFGDRLTTLSHFYGLAGADLLRGWGARYLPDGFTILPHLGGGYAWVGGAFIEMRMRGRERWNGRKFGDVSLVLGWRRQ
jgi:hypothetical protein